MTTSVTVTSHPGFMLCHPDGEPSISIASRAAIIEELLKYTVINGDKQDLITKLSPRPGIVGPMDAHLETVFGRINDTDPVSKLDGLQTFIYNYVNGANISSIAVAGAGKTTALISLYKSMPKRKTIIITYNKQLQLKIAETIIEQSLENLNAYTFHGLAGRIYGETIQDDYMFKKYIDRPLATLFSAGFGSGGAAVAGIESHR
jgi:hypothetical protein